MSPAPISIVVSTGRILGSSTDSVDGTRLFGRAVGVLLILGLVFLVVRGIYRSWARFKYGVDGRRNRRDF